MDKKGQEDKELVETMLYEFDMSRDQWCPDCFNYFKEKCLEMLKVKNNLMEARLKRIIKKIDDEFDLIKEKRDKVLSKYPEFNIEIMEKKDIVDCQVNSLSMLNRIKESVLW